jgi:Dolichol-phosphate mannosyltransferase subunit 3 (DPM3).
MLKLLGIKSSRGSQLTVNFILVSLLWWYFFNLELGSSYEFAVSAVPYWFLVTFGCYALIKIGFGLFWLRDCVEDSASLDIEIKQAKEFLTKKGFKG